MACIAKLFHTSEHYVDSLLNQRLQSAHARHAEIWRQRRAPIPVDIVLHGGEHAKVNSKEFGEERVFIGFATCGSRDVDLVIEVLSWPVSSPYRAMANAVMSRTYRIVNVHFPR